MLTVANPDGRLINKRENARGVDLNRNFSVHWGETKNDPGAHPESEPETKAISAMLGSQKYLAAVDVHGHAPWVVIPSPQTHKGDKGKPNSPHKRFLDLVKQVIPVLGPKYLLTNPSELGDGGAFEDNAFWRLGIPSLCLELSQELKELKEPLQVNTEFLKYELFISEFFKKILEDAASAKA